MNVNLHPVKCLAIYLNVITGLLVRPPQRHREFAFGVVCAYFYGEFLEITRSLHTHTHTHTQEEDAFPFVCFVCAVLVRISTVERRVYDANAVKYLLASN